MNFTHSLVIGTALFVLSIVGVNIFLPQIMMFLKNHHEKQQAKLFAVRRELARQKKINELLGQYQAACKVYHNKVSAVVLIARADILLGDLEAEPCWDKARTSWETAQELAQELERHGIKMEPLPWAPYITI